MSHITTTTKKENTMNKIPNENIIKVSGEMLRLCEFIKDRLYFTTISGQKDPSSCPSAHFFSIDDEFVYVNYYNDFGPLNLGHLYRYCVKLRSKLNCASLVKVIHYTTPNPQKRANAAFLIASFAVIFLNRTPKEAYRILLSENGVPFKPFQDASLGNSSYQLRLLECLEGLHRALQCGFVHFNDFCVEEFELYSKMEHGDMNWIIPQKFIAFCGPVSNPGPTNHRRPEDYYDYFLMNNVTIVIRLSKREYDAHSTFGKMGIKHYDLYFLDGGIPSMTILNKFLAICEDAAGAIAVHCKAGLGRTGSLIGAYMIKHYRMKAKEVIAWMRICRPGSVIGKQQAWLEDLEEDLWTAGDVFRRKRHGDGDRMPYHKYGIYSIAEKLSQSPIPPRPRSPRCEPNTAPRPRVNVRIERARPVEAEASAVAPSTKEVARNKTSYPAKESVPPTSKGTANSSQPPVNEGPSSKSSYTCHPMQSPPPHKGAAYPSQPPVNESPCSKSAYTCQPMQSTPTRHRKSLVPHDAAAGAGASGGGSSMAGTSGMVRPCTPSSMRHLNPHQLRPKKLAYVTSKTATTPASTKTKQKEEETQGDKLRRVKYLKETVANYVNRSPPRR